jgi:uncharacterized repeat protein (TIGR01451 family)/CSLREA domain-containing protein
MPATGFPDLSAVQARLSRPAGGRLLVALTLATALFAVQAAHADIFTVTGSGDTAAIDSVCTLREAILAANGTASSDCPPTTSGTTQIHFNVPDPGPVGPGGTHTVTISPVGQLPTLTTPMVIDGTTQPAHGGPAAACPAAGAALGTGSYGPLLIVIDGSGSGFITISSSASGATIRGLVMNNFATAPLSIQASGGNHIECNLLATDAVGAVSATNSISIQILGGSDNVIEDNLVATAGGSSLRGVSIENVASTATDRTIIRNNRIGTNAAGTASLGGAQNVLVLGGSVGSSDGTIIEGNLIAGGIDGIVLQNVHHSRVRGNRIGTNASGTAAIALGGSDIQIVASDPGLSVTDNIVGTDGDGVNDAAEGNLISGANLGVSMCGCGAGSVASGNRIAGNLIGTDVTGMSAIPNRFGVNLTSTTGGNVVGTNGDGISDALERNVISGNLTIGIEVQGDGDRVSGNYIGVAIDGLTALSNTVGIQFGCTAPAPVGAVGNLVGTNADGKSDALERNIISGNTGAPANVPSGINFGGNDCSKQVVAGNYIGLDVTGKIAVPNSQGIRLVNGSHDNLIGTNGDGVRDDVERNVISGNLGDGIFIQKFFGDAVFNNHVAGNWIGLDATGGAVVPNGTSSGGGIRISGPSNNVIGSGAVPPNPAEGNVIAGHSASGQYGVEVDAAVGGTGALATGNVIAGNVFGTNATRSAVFPNAIAIQLVGTTTTPSSTARVEGNVIFASTVRGVSLSSNANFLATSDQNCVVRNADGVHNFTAALTPTFEQNWWGASTGANTAGADTAEAVDFSNPLLTAPAGCPSSIQPAIGKSFLDAQINVNGTTTLTITISNPSAATTATAVSFSDVLPAGLVLASIPTATGCGSPTVTGTIGSGTLGISGGTIAPASTCTVSATVKGTTAGTKSNQITNLAATAGAGSVTGGTSNIAEVIVAGSLTLSKTDGVTTAVAGGSVTYTIGAGNPSGSAVTGATVADSFPATLTCTWTCIGADGGTCTASGSGDINDTINLPTTGTATYTAVCAVSPAATGSLVNTATLTAPAPDGSVITATDTDAIVDQADLSITKTDGVTTATPGSAVTYTITAANAGPSAAPGSTVTDIFPAGLTCTWTCSGSGGTCTASGSGNISDTASLQPGGSVTYVAVCAISPAASGTLSNTATVAVGAGITDPTPGNNSATDSDTLTPQAELAISKSDGVTSAVPGHSVTYMITASNAGPSNAPGALISDTFPASLTCTWTCTGAGGATCTASGSGNLADSVNLPSGGSVTYAANCTVSAGATGSLSNTATVAAPAGVTDPTPGDNSSTDTDTLTPQADLAITKTDGVTSAVPGQSVTYTITASNAGPSNAPGALVSDTFPASLTCTWICVGASGATCTASGAGNLAAAVSLPSGGSVTYTASCSIAANATGTLTNTATVAAPSGVTDPSMGNNSATDSDTLTPQADLAITKTDGVTTATPGGSVTYTITASNIGPSDAPAASVADPFPAALSCTWTCAGASGGTCTASGSGALNDTVHLPSGASVTYTASCSISAAATGSLSNTATVNAGAVTDPAPANNSATDTDTLAPQADLAITKTDGVTTAAPGGSVTYTIKANNSGPSNAPGATVTDTFPASLTCTWTCVGAGGGTCTASGSGNLSDTVDLPNGSSVTYTASCSISASATGTLSNTATVGAPAGVTDPTPGNNSATDVDTLAPQADLAITNTDGVTQVTPGGAVTYTITASNGGPSDAAGATVVDTFPAALTCTWTCAGSGGGTCTASGSGNLNDTVNLPAGGVVTYTASCTISASATGAIINTATVTAPAGVTDPDPANNSATDTDSTLVADLSITATDGVTTATPGHSVTYTITAANGGPSAVIGAMVADSFPADCTTVTYSSTASGGASGNTPSGSGNLNDTLSLPNGASVTYSVACSISPSATGTLAGTATITAPATFVDPVSSNNSATDIDTLSPEADLGIDKTVSSPTFVPGETITYTIVATNAGPSDAVGVGVSDPFPAACASVAFSSVRAGGASGNTLSGNGSISDTVNLPAGASVTYTATCTTSSGQESAFTNTASLAVPAGVTDPNPRNDTSGVTATPQLSVAEVPTLDPRALVLLALLLAASALRMQRH